MNNVPITLTVDKESNEKLEQLAKHSMRNKSSMVRFLVHQEWNRTFTQGEKPKDTLIREEAEVLAAREL